MKKPKAISIAVVIAAKDEAKTITKTLESLKKIFKAKDIYLVNDASTDKTLDIAKKFKVNIFSNLKNIGKTKSLHLAITKGRLCSRYEAVLFIDADTHVHPGFVKHITPHIQKPDTAVVIGQVKSDFIPNNPVIAYRYYSYVKWQQFWKRLFAKFNAITISPGTASVYKTKYLKHLTFDSNLIIEDFDLTFQIHRGRYGKIVYVPQALVFTQDPNNFRDYYKQMVRWNLGQLQPMLKHKIPLQFQPFELALSFLFIQNFLHATFVLTVPAFLLSLTLKSISDQPSILTTVETYYTLVLVADFFLLVVTALFVTLKHNKLINPLHYPFFWVMQVINAIAMYHAFYKLFSGSKTSVWKSPSRWRTQEFRSNPV